MRTSIMIHNEIRALQEEQRAVPADAEDRAEQLYRLDGRLDQLQVELAAALEHEDELRAAPGTPATPSASSLTEMIFGARSDFNGIGRGFKASVTIPAAPAVTDPAIPGFPDAPRGFADTLMQSGTEGAVTYLRRGPRTNAAAQWSTGDKPQSAYVWTEHTAPLAWIAHHSPITKTQASDWSQLDGIVRGEMSIGLAQARSREAIAGSNSSGIVGITNTVGIQTHTVASGDNAYDAIRRMVTKVMLNSGFIPTHVAVSPMVDEALDLMKDENKQYLVMKVGNRVWNLEIVLDNGLTIAGPDDKLHFGALVYAPVGATWYTKETDNIEIGLVDDQFINNAYTLLAEGRHAMAVRFPDAFCFCADAIPAVDIEDESS